MTENEFRETMHHTVQEHDDAITNRWLASIRERSEQPRQAMYAFFFVNCNFNQRVLNAVYRMEPFSILKIPEAALRVNAGDSPDVVAEVARSAWEFRLGFAPTSSITYRPLGLYTLVADGRVVHFYSPFSHIHGLSNPFIGLENYAHAIGKNIVDAFYAADGNPALADWFDDDLPHGTTIFRRTFDREANLLLSNLRTCTAIGPVYRQDYDHPENSYALIDHIG